MITTNYFRKSVKEFEKFSGEINYYTLARNLMVNGYEIESMLLILTTWNFAKFRLIYKSFNIIEFERKINSLKSNFKRIENEELLSTDWGKYKNEIKTIFNTLSAIRGIEFTGTPKLLHLKAPNLFVMWDSYIRGEKSKKYYSSLEIFKNSIIPFKRYKKDFDGYFEFLTDMKRRFQNIKPINNKLLTKSIDEFNFINITLPIQELEKKNKLKRTDDNFLTKMTK